MPATATQTGTVGRDIYPVTPMHPNPNKVTHEQLREVMADVIDRAVFIRTGCDAVYFLLHEVEELIEFLQELVEIEEDVTS